jgi:hypothetical protein
LFWLEAECEDEGGTTAAAAERMHRAAKTALQLLHPRDMGLRAAFATFSSAAVEATCGDGASSCRRVAPCACLARLSVELSAAVRSGVALCSHLPLPQRAVAGALFEAEAACAALAVGERLCGREDCGALGAAGFAERASEALRAVSDAGLVVGVCGDSLAAESWQALFAAAAERLPATPCLLAELRAARRAIAAAAAERVIPSMALR